MTEPTEQEIAAEAALAAIELKTKENLDSIRELFKASEYISAWETGFLASVRGQLERGRVLSEKQQDVLDKLITKVAARYD
jgi:hypothetical protein